MYIFETSWEVCNRVGGIYAVLSTRAASMQRIAKDKVVFFGPDLEKVFGAAPSPYFLEDSQVLDTWREKATKAGLKVRVGRWNVPGEPIAVLLDFRELYDQKDQIYAHVWERFQVKSHAAYGDYDESSLFGYYAGMAMESLYRHIKQLQTVAHFNEWQTSFGLFYIKEHCPKIGTLFTTHATGIGRSIAGNNKPLYDYFDGYNGNQMADELNMTSKHSAERQAAHFADCFTTVSDITAKECKQLLDKPVDIVTPNGFEPDFVPKGKTFNEKRARAREALLRVAGEVCGYHLPEDSMLCCISGRFEWKNKGIDAYLHTLSALEHKLGQQHGNRPVVAFLMIPGWISGAKTVLGKDDHWTTHRLCNYLADPVLHTVQTLGLWNTPGSHVKVIYVPSYLNGDDGIFNMSYYDLLIGMDATVFPSYYEPWGYTPLEANAFHVPTITTNLSGYGQWVASQDDLRSTIENGVEVVRRTDSNWSEMIEQLADALYRFSQLQEKDVKAARKAAAAIAERAEWKHFFPYYEQAYKIALSHAKQK
ncbi:MAG: glycogen/starch synthase [Paludibacteraceae bacterium]|nr:glycogen/starch synthase [Paludibacteraceae bacterium]